MSNLMLTMDSEQYVCTSVAPILRLVGYALMVFKIAIPLIIVILGLIDLAQAAISSKPEEIKKTMVSMIWRVVGGFAIFIIPGLIISLFGMVSGFDKATDVDKGGIADWGICKTCLNNGWSGKCKAVDICMSKEGDPEPEDCYTCFDNSDQKQCRESDE